MLLNIFIIFLAISFVLIALGFLLDLAPLVVGGFAFLFVLAMVILNGNLEVKTGEMDTIVYGNNLTGYHWDYDDADSPNFNSSILNSPESIFLLHKNTTDVYTEYDDENRKTIGIFLTVLAIFGVSFAVYLVWGRD